MASFLTELNRVAKAVAKEQARAAREAERERNAAIRKAEQARKADERAAIQLERANAADRKRLEKEAKEAHIAAMMAEVDRRNLELEEKNTEIDTLLAATLDVDDFVDLEKLRVKAEHPPVDRPDLETPVPAPKPLPDPPEPTFLAPPPPTRVDRMLGGKKHSQAVERATAWHEEAMAKWSNELAQLKLDRKAAAEKHQRAEAQRLAQLAAQSERYAAECAARETQAAESNAGR